VTEDFYYDALNRFDKSERTPAGGATATNADVTLDAIGNIQWKQGVGNYAYHATQKRAVVAAGSNSYGYDANGNMNVRNGANIGYTSYNLPNVINAPGGYSSTISYGAFRNRFKQVAIGPQGTETTIYVAGLLEKVTNAQGTHYRHYIQGGKGTAAIHSRTVGGSNATFYLHRDHLGSPELITDSSGNALVRPSFAAYGERRDGTDWDGPISSADLNTLAGISRRGFTGHEHLDAVNLIHMNGRVFEPVAGRFLSRDPFIDGVASSQGMNGYAYVHNSPLSFVDPSGFNCEPLPGMSDEEAAAYISRCSGEFESSGWGPASGESGRWCTELGIGCRLRATDPVDFGVSGSASGFGEVPLSPFTQRALNAYEAMVAASGAAGALRNGTGWVECGEPGLAGCGAYDPHELMQEVERAIARANALLAMEMLSAELIRRQAGMSEGSLGTNRSHALIRTVGRGGLGSLRLSFSSISHAMSLERRFIPASTLAYFFCSSEAAFSSVLSLHGVTLKWVEAGRL